MRRLIFMAMFWPTLAVAQVPQPITLTPQEYNEVLGALVSRDPVMSLLVQKQNAAQQAARSEPTGTKEQPKEPSR